MRLTFLGHAAFLIQTADTQIITDPYSSDIGYLPLEQRADFVTISHHNPQWHSCLDAVSGEFEVIDGLKILDSGATWGEISFGSVLVYEGENQGENEGENAMVCIESEGIRVLHTGDCGVLPDDETLEKCGRVDILLALAGGEPTLKLDDLMVLTEKLAPKIVIPMHYGVPGLKMQALGVEEIEGRFAREQIVRHAGSGVDFLWNSLPQKMELHVLKPLRAAI